LVGEQKQLTQGLNLKRLFLGARMPDYHNYHQLHPTGSAEEYVYLEKEQGKKLDSEIRFYESQGLKIIKVIPNYGPDNESEDYGVIMSWENPDFIK